MAFERVHYLPILITVWFPITFAITYIIAVYNTHVSPLFPFISETGAFSPESCIFGQMLNLGALMMAACCYFRYLQLRNLKESNHLSDCVKKHNRISLILGLMASAGTSIVGNFQEVNALVVHIIGACLAFGVGGIYCSIQTYISILIHPIIGTKTMNRCRVILSAGIIIFLLVFAFAGAIYYSEDETGLIRDLKPGDPGWRFMSTLSEWMLAFCEIIYLGTFTQDFKRISLTGPNISSKFK